MEVSKELFDEFVQWLKFDGLTPKKSERLWKKTIFSRLLLDDKKTLDNWEDFMVDFNLKQTNQTLEQDLDENCLRGIGVNVSGVHKTIQYVVKGGMMSRVFFEDGSDLDVDNTVLLKILDSYARSLHD
jgi:hypothetical protein